ncbi:MAG TPA: universal stress protein [Streptosporangiaceae bacterium]
MNQQIRLRGLVVGVHGSAASLAALRWAAREANLRGIPLSVVYAWEDETKQLAPYAPSSRVLAKTAGRACTVARVREAVQNELGPSSSVTVTTAEGPPARMLLGSAADAELLVLGNSSTTTAAGLGPVTRACLRNAPCPVAVVYPAGTGISGATVSPASAPTRNGRHSLFAGVR